MTRGLTLLAWAVTHPAPWSYLAPRLKLDRKPHSAADRLEIEMFRALAPIIAQSPGDRARIRRACPDRWLFALDIALCLPDWWLARAGAIPDLLTDWTRKGSKDWELPPYPVSVADPEHHMAPRLEVAA